MSHDEDDWFDEDADGFEIPSDEKKKEKRPAKRRRPHSDDWDEGDSWDSDLSELPY